MAGISCQQETTYTHSLGASLMNFVRRDVRELVLQWSGMSWKHFLELFRLFLDALFCRKADIFAISDAPYVSWQPPSQIPVLRINYEVEVVPAELVKIVVHLEYLSASSPRGEMMPYICRYDLYIPRSAWKHAFPKERPPNYAFCPVAAYNIVCLYPATPSGCRYLNPCLLLVLAKTSHRVVIPYPRQRVTPKVCP
jgi:hypothetical protein